MGQKEKAGVAAGGSARGDPRAFRGVGLAGRRVPSTLHQFVEPDVLDIQIVLPYAEEEIGSDLE